MSEEVRKRNTGTGQGEAENVSENINFPNDIMFC